MLRIRNILVARDDAPCSDQALNEALLLARRTGAALHILRVEVLRDEPMAEVDYPASGVDKVRERLKRISDEQSPNGGIFAPGSTRVFHHLVRGKAPATAILECAEQYDVDLIVVGTHGRRGIKRTLIGSVAEEVVRRATCPVLTVHAVAEEAQQGIKSILVPIDFSEHSREALRYAAVWAEYYGARLDLLHVIEEYVQPDFYSAGMYSVYIQQPDLESRALEQMKDLAQRVVGNKREVFFHVITGRAPSGIIDFARRAGTDFIVMSTHGHTAMKHFVLGSVAEQVIRYASCPVLTVKAFGKSLLKGGARAEAAAA